ncbi:MAG: esterase-like activity of phytase family protein [Acidobacteriota bacterium]|nr:MAG: esterase-like activity of phytase family protein [Acidobacteriota bacterium]
MARALACLTVGLLACCAWNSERDRTLPPSLSFVADFNVSHGTRFDTLGDESFGGISGVAYDSASGNWIALADARSRSRFYELSVVYDGGVLHVRPIGLTRFRDGAGEAFPENVLDPEGIAETPWGTLLISTEADSRREPVEQAKLLEFDASGHLLRRLELPEKFVTEGWPPEKGVRHNLGFESLTLSPDGTKLFVGAEESLLQDGPQATFDRGALCRIVEYRVGDGEIAPFAEYAYPLGPVARPSELEDVDLDVGLVELVALAGSKLLALERDFIRERAGSRRGRRAMSRARIFLVDVGEATDVSGLASLENAGEFRPVRKELLLDFDDIVPKLSPAYPLLDNFEAMGLGPVLPDGGRSLLVVSDDNFSDRQRSAFLLFSLKAVEP